MFFQPGCRSETGGLSIGATQILRQESSIRWRLELRTKAHRDLEAKTTALGGLVTIRGTWTHIVISYQYEMWFLMIGAQ